MYTPGKYVICEINEEDVKVDLTAQEPNYRLRRAARGILIKDGKIVLLNVTSRNYHKLPGGGLNKGEDIEDGFRREVKEETGWDCQIIDKNPVIIEYRKKSKILQISYIFVALAIGKPSRQQLEEDEIAEGHDLEWVPFENVKELMSKEKPKEYDDKFIHLRDTRIIDFYKDKFVSLARL
jgi:ADP-ribose pyrophosphatase YjhB (NUDIX family)